MRADEAPNTAITTMIKTLIQIIALLAVIGAVSSFFSDGGETTEPNSSGTAKKVEVAENSSSSNEKISAASTNGVTKPQLDLIPYTIIKTIEDKPYKRSFDVLVDAIQQEDRLPNESELQEISLKLKGNDVEKTFVSFYLPGMEIGSGAFATAHHDPLLKVQLLASLGIVSLPDEYQILLRK